MTSNRELADTIVTIVQRTPHHKARRDITALLDSVQEEAVREHMKGILNTGTAELIRAEHDKVANQIREEAIRAGVRGVVVHIQRHTYGTVWWQSVEAAQELEDAIVAEVKAGL